MIPPRNKLIPLAVLAKRIGEFLRLAARDTSINVPGRKPVLLCPQTRAEGRFVLVRYGLGRWRPMTRAAAEGYVKGLDAGQVHLPFDSVAEIARKVAVR